MEQQEINSLLEKYQGGTASPAEINALHNWYREMGYADGVYPDEELLVKNRIHNKLIDTINPVKKARLWPRIAVAAAAVAVIVSSVYFYNRQASLKTTQQTAVVNDIAPGKNGATITLGNGKVIQLSDAKSGVVVGGEEGLVYNDNTSVISSAARDLSNSIDKGSLLRRDDGHGVDGKGGEAGAAAQMLMASTAKGQTYQFTLPDGTKVWLNADSKISFPSQFSGKQRKILLNGEGYFEVAKDKAHPFMVETDQQIVEVLGTHFNINSYKDEGAVRTTLLEGSVRVQRFSSAELAKGSVLPAARDDGEGKARAGASKGGEAVVLRPSQQSIVTGSNRIVVKEVDANDAVAWKNNEFSFKKENLQDIMRRVERWYDVEIVYAPDFKSQSFTGSVSRFDNLSSVLKVLELTGKVHFKVEGRRVTVMK